MAIRQSICRCWTTQQGAEINGSGPLRRISSIFFHESTSNTLERSAGS
jgi:hypothetical protein